jgi:hypothetical protein
MGSDTAKGQGIAFATDHGIGGGIGEKMRRALLGFASADLVFVFVFDGAMLGQFDQIDRDSASPLAQTLGHQASQQGCVSAQPH